MVLGRRHIVLLEPVVNNQRVLGWWIEKKEREREIEREIKERSDR